MARRCTTQALLCALLLVVAGCDSGFDRYAPEVVSPAAGPADYRIFIHYELGMHCTGFDFSYCCVLPPYNSIQAQVVRVGERPMRLGADPTDPSVVVEPDTKRRFRLRYRIVDNSFSEFAKLFYWEAKVDIDGDGNDRENGETVSDAEWTHLYLYTDLKGSNPRQTSLDAEKQFVGVGPLALKRDHGPTGAYLKGGNLEWSGERGTVVFTKSPVLDNVPIHLTNPHIWEALGLPLTPLLDSEREGKSFRTVVEEDIQPYQVAEVTLVDAATGEPVRGTDAKVVRYTGTEPIDMPACLNCHAGPRPNAPYKGVWAKVEAERSYWLSIDSSPWVADLKAAAISILAIHDARHGTTFTANYHAVSSANRLGRDTVICQKCHADSVIGVLAGGALVERDHKLVVVDYANVDGGFKPEAGRGAVREVLAPTREQAAAYRQRIAASRPLPGRPKGLLLPPLSEAIHATHQSHSPLADGVGRSGACQSCHPAHRYDRSLKLFPLDHNGLNPFAHGDNRDGAGGCYQGRDVHSNPNRNTDGVSTPSHLNAIGRWLDTNVAQEKRADGTARGLWCTNCHSEVSRMLYQTDHLQSGHVRLPEAGDTVRTAASLAAVAKGLGSDAAQLAALLDPMVRVDPTSHRDRGPTALPWASRVDRRAPDIAVIATKGGGPVVATDGDGDLNVTLLDANPTQAAAHAAQGGVAVSYDVASDGRDYWLAAGEPHCADCHAPPFVESEGGGAFPIDQPGKYSLMRYATGHAGLPCQTCHESIHGLYPVTRDVDPTTYQQAASLNPDHSHGPIRCGSCHQPVNPNGVPVKYAARTFRDIETGKEGKVGDSYDLAVQWIHATAP